MFEENYEEFKSICRLYIVCQIFFMKQKEYEIIILNFYIFNNNGNWKLCDFIGIFINDILKNKSII